MKIYWWHIVLFIVIVGIVAIIIHPSKIQTGWMLLKSHQIEEAISKYKEAHKKDPENYRVLNEYARTLETAGRIEEATPLYEKLVAKRPIDKNYKNLIRFYQWSRQQEKLKKAYEDWHQLWLKENRSFDSREGRELLAKLYSLYLLDHQYDKALEIINEQLIIEPDNYDFRSNLIKLYEKTGNFNSTINELEKRLKSDPNDEEALIKMLNLAPIAGKEVEAERYIIAAMKNDPKNKKLREDFINFGTKANRLDTMDKWYLAWISEDPENEKLKKEYLDFLATTEQTRKTITYLEKLTDDYPENPYYLKQLIDLYEWTNQTDKLYPIYLSRFENNPRDKKNNEKLLNILFDWKRYDEAKRTLIKLLSIFPGNKEYTLLLLDIYELNNERSKAIALLETAYKANRDKVIAKTLGEYYFADGQYNKSYDIFYSLLGTDDPEITRYLGEIKSTQGDNEEAVELFKEYIALDPNNYYGHFRLGETYKLLGKDKLSRQELLTARDLLITTKKDLEAQITEARIDALLGNYPVAEEKFAHLAEKNPKNRDIVSPYMETLIEANNPDQALKTLQTFEQRFPMDRNLVGYKARLLVQQKKYDEAKDLLISLIQEYPEDYSLKSELAYLYYDLGDWYNARPLFQEVLDHNPSNLGIAKTLKDIWFAYQPVLFTGFRWTDLSAETRNEPYIGYRQYFNSKWWFDTVYMLGRDSGGIAGIVPNFTKFTNEITSNLYYKPHRYVTLSPGYINQFNGSKYQPAGQFNAKYEHPKYGQFLISTSFNTLLKDPVSALDYDATKDIAGARYSNAFTDWLYFDTGYQSRWYKVDSSKTINNMGTSIGRDDIAWSGVSFRFLKTPELRIAYQFIYVNLHLDNNYLPQIPLIENSERHEIRLEFYHDWNDRARTEASAFTGHDRRRNIDLSSLDLYGFTINQWLRLTDHFEVNAGYEYSSEDILGIGRYQSANIEFLYRF